MVGRNIPEHSTEEKTGIVTFPNVNISQMLVGVDLSFAHCVMDLKFSQKSLQNHKNEGCKKAHKSKISTL